MNQIQGFLRKLYRGIDSERSKSLEKLLDRGEWALIQKETLRKPGTYKDAAEYFRDALCVEITRKMLIPTDKDKCYQAAVATFWETEAQCRATNVRLSRFRDFQGPFEPQDLAICDFIGQWRRELAYVLGKAPSRLTPRFSGGSTLSDQGKRVTIPDKLLSQPTVYTGSDQTSLQRSLNGTPFFLKPLKEVRSNRFFTVPKDSSKDRGCCIEASLMVSLQLDAGKHIERRIEKVYKVNLANGKPYHQWLAQIASRHGTFSTIDLSNASDTVAFGLVQLLLPSDWLSLLNSLRAGSTDLDGQTVLLSKYSSMGNGFTFPLETLLFWTLGKVIGSRCITVFGDDIIVETEHHAAMVAALRYFGFTPNAKKTFCDGPFRESCGGDYFEGTLVRAHYLKEVPSEPQHWVSLANGLRRVDPDQTYTKAAWRYCVDQVPVGWRNFCADSSLGDFAFYDPAAKPQLRFFAWPEHRKMFGRRVGDLLPAWRGMTPITRTYDLFKHIPFEIAIIAASMGTAADVPLRDSVTGYRPGFIAALS